MSTENSRSAAISTENSRRVGLAENGLSATFSPGDPTCSFAMTALCERMPPGVTLHPISQQNLTSRTHENCWPRAVSILGIASERDSFPVVCSRDTAGGSAANISRSTCIIRSSTRRTVAMRSLLPSPSAVKKRRFTPAPYGYSTTTWSWYHLPYVLDVDLDCATLPCSSFLMQGSAQPAAPRSVDST